MDIEFLKTFLEVNRTRHFGKAADNLFVTQSTVSARIRQLEEDLGAPLFIRARNDIQLTPTGKRLLKYAENILTTWNRARQDIAIQEQDQLPLVVAGLPSLWDTILQEWIGKLAQEDSQFVLQGEVLSTESITRRLLEGTLDIGFMFDAPQASSLHIHEITKIPLVLVSTIKDLTPADAMQENYILVDWGTSFSITHARHYPEAPMPSMRLGQGRIARDYIIANGGTAYLAEPTVSEYLESGTLHSVEGAPAIERTATAVYSSKTDKQEMIEQLLSLF